MLNVHVLDHEPVNTLTLPFGCPKPGAKAGFFYPSQWDDG